MYGLGLLAENFDHDSPDFYHHYKIVNVEKPNRELKGLQFVFVELPKFKPTTHSEKKLQVLWLRFLSEINEETKKVDPELLSVPEIREAIELTEEAGYTSTELATYETYWDAVSTERTLLSERYELGQTERNFEIAQKLLAKNVAIPLIAEVIGLTESEVRELKNSIFLVSEDFQE